MNLFKVGQKVRCVDDSPCVTCGGHSGVISGRVYTIDDFADSIISGAKLLRLLETLPHYCPGLPTIGAYCSERFIDANANPFKPGDIVECIHTFWPKHRLNCRIRTKFRWPEKLEQFKVKSIDGDTMVLWGVELCSPRETSWHHSYFRLVQPEQPKPTTEKGEMKHIMVVIGPEGLTTAQVMQNKPECALKDFVQLTKGDSRSRCALIAVADASLKSCTIARYNGDVVELE